MKPEIEALFLEAMEAMTDALAADVAARTRLLALTRKFGKYARAQIARDRRTATARAALERKAAKTWAAAQ